MKSRIVSKSIFSVVLVGTILISLFAFNDVFAAQTVNNRIEIDENDISGSIEADDLFGYGIESIGDLDNDGVIDLAVIKFHDDSGRENAGSVDIMFMNSDGSVKSITEITQTTDSIGSSCLAPINVDKDTLEQIAFIGDLDGDGMPTLALGVSKSNHTAVNTGGIYNLELKPDGTVDNCFLIIPNNSTYTSGFAPADNVYDEEPGSGFLSWPLIATDVNGDGQNELIAGADSQDDNYTNLWVLFLNSTGGVDSHPTNPIFGNGDIGIDDSDFMDDGDTISGGTKLVVSSQNGGTGEGSVFIVELTTAGAFSSSTKITGISLGQGIDSTDAFGSGVAPLGDMDNDGVDDILVGNENGDDTNANSGEAYILFMNNDNTVKESQKISNESEFTRTGIAPFASVDLFGHGMTLWKNEGGNAVIAIGAHQDDTGEINAGAIHLFYIERASDTLSIKKKGGSSGDTIPSTLGVNSRGERMVDDGFSYNGKTVNVDNYHTKFPLMSVIVGFPNTVEMKIYENGGLSKINRVQFGLGVKEVGTPLSESEVIILINLHYNGTSVESIVFEGDENLLVINATKVALSIVECKVNYSSECLLVSLTYTYREAPSYPMMVVNTMDDNRNSWNYYFNDGVKVIGSMNSPPTNTIFVKNGNQDRGEHLTLTRIDKIKDIWKNMYDIEYQHNNGAFVRITPYDSWTCNDPPLDQINVPTRQNCNFRALTTIWG